ncbi:N-acetyltransferase [Thermobispora bispora]|jgi:GNAT superfamily N-acetyltransferase|uniref:GCN5-related N-acetyltransferase n=1 Tax=Thermobispora bispora (strain ATCC 19993 / DSM 43833 / CBS 139.67 / JCM 10125 / KCTC 9307 / NBRC 14880 / R51) TaxID=469371 RepID=D6Y2L2_THEBD|nr:GNAT family N-acetyltransferase [Thermobispora bispora]MBO2473445.1 N-acetyltransferase [Actinomycetales bacterium]MDI9582396.1 GNAT family N-acetyltransferase [Thermobispora sp.]ADG88861.1 GCN5-related N-acetyltransferase [Thermobispora bispora DSM 43833]MBX6167648.1 GNAT family N-acetyltransferase [Thermobispora bispora]QSI48619.1 N-acetyltransferase [Thermobispora bispora]
MKSGDLRLRRAEKSDANEIFALAREFGITFRPEREAFDAALPRLLEDEDAFLTVATVDGVIRGYLLGFVHLTLFANGPVAYVEEAIIEHGFRRHGIGRRLLEEFEAWARSRGAGYVSIATRRAAEFFHALGYEVSGTYYRKLLK